MSMNSDESWVDLLRSVGKELGLDVARQARSWPPTAPPPPSAATSQTVGTAPPGTRLIESSETATREELAELFESLGARVRQGEISLDTGAYSVRFDVPQSVAIDLAAVTQDHDDDTEVELGIVVSWRTPRTRHQA